MSMIDWDDAIALFTQSGKVLGSRHEITRWVTQCRGRTTVTVELDAYVSRYGGGNRYRVRVHVYTEADDIAESVSELSSIIRLPDDDERTLIPILDPLCRVVYFRARSIEFESGGNGSYTVLIGGDLVGSPESKMVD